METVPCPKNHAALRLHAKVFPGVSVGKVPRLPPQLNLTDCSWPFLGSFIVHAVLVALISSPAFHYPLMINSPTPSILWFSPILPPPPSEETEEPLHGTATAFAAQQKAPEGKPDLQDTVKYSEPDVKIVSETPPDPEPNLTVAEPLAVINTAKSVRSHSSPPDSQIPSPVPAPLKTVSVPLAAEPESPRALPLAQQAVAASVERRVTTVENLLQNEEDRNLRHIIEQKQQAAEKLVRERELLSIQKKNEQERAALEKKQLAAERRREQIAREQQLRAIEERQGQERAAAEKARQKQVADEKEFRKRKIFEEARHGQEMKDVAREKAEQNLSEIKALKNKPAPLQAKKAPEAQSPVKPAERQASVSLPLVKGDLKLVITGSIQPDAAVTFINFAQSRRNRPFSRAEARKSSRIVPLIADTRDTTREIVITRADQGVYTITGVSANGTASVTLSLKLYEGTSRAVTRDLGRHAITGKKILVKILMPEGILWDDNAAFSGNMEDSDGLTKFNTETGLMWKEFSE